MPALFVSTLSVEEKSDYVREFERPVPTREISLVFRRDQWKMDILKSLWETIAKSLPAGLTLHDPKRQLVLDSSGHQRKDP